MAAEVLPGTIDVTRASKVLRSDEYQLLLSGRPLAEVRIESTGWKFWQQRYSATVGGQHYQLDNRRAAPGSNQIVDQSGQIVASEHERKTLEYGGRRLRLTGWNGIDAVDDEQRQRLLELRWESGGGSLSQIMIHQPVSAELLAIAALLALRHQSAGGGGG